MQHVAPCEGTFRRELDVLITCMDNVDDASTTFVDMYMEAEVDIPIDMEDLEIYNYELVKRICSKMIMLKDSKSNVSKECNLSSSTFRRLDTGMQAAAIAAELEVKLQYMYMEAEQCKLDRNRTEKELAIAKAGLRAVNEVNGLQDVSQTQSVTIERLSYTNCIDGFMQWDSVHYPVNELDNQFEGSVVVPPGGCFGTSPLDFRAVNEVNGLQDVSQTQSVTIERLPYANCIDGFVQLDTSIQLNTIYPPSIALPYSNGHAVTDTLPAVVNIGHLQISPAEKIGYKKQSF